MARGTVRDELARGERVQGARLREADVGRQLGEGFGQVLLADVGKRVWLRAEGLVMENAAQRDAARVRVQVGRLERPPEPVQPPQPLGATSMTLTAVEVGQLVREALEGRGHRVGEVRLQAGQQHDPMDRPMGVACTGATVQLLPPAVRR